MKILNLYAGIGGNRKLWGNEHEITAVEWDRDIASIYKDLFPNDTVILADAHEYLLQHCLEYDFIWTSPPCPTHSRARMALPLVYPDMKLYEEVLLLQERYAKLKKDGKYVVENVISYYDPLIPPQKIQRHYFWSNINLSNIKFPPDNIKGSTIQELEAAYNYDLSKYPITAEQKYTALKNCVRPEVGKAILDDVVSNRQQRLI